MSETTGPFAPVWTVHVTLGSAIFALVMYIFAGGRGTGVLTSITVTGVTYILYKWGQYRDPPAKHSDDDSKRCKEMEMEAEAGSYGSDI